VPIGPEGVRFSMATPSRKRARDRFGLTRRELDVVSKLVQGYTNKRMGLALSISTEAVHRHLAKIFKKLDVRNRLEAVLFSVYYRLNSWDDTSG
jgi:DNA-binding NarL/FixJ family response regulator